MQVRFHKKFETQLKKFPESIREQFFGRLNFFLSKKLQGQVKERLTLFTLDPFHPLLNNHKLSGEYRAYLIINVTGDFRVVYRHLHEETVFLSLLGHTASCTASLD